MLVIRNPIDDLGYREARKLADASIDGTFTAADLARAVGGWCDGELWLRDLQERELCGPRVDTGVDARRARWGLVEVDLHVGTIYEVLCIRGSSYRILSEPGIGGQQPVLYHRDLFGIVDPEVPPCWIDDGNSLAPKEWSEPGFFERFFDDDKDAQAAFVSVVQQHFPATWARIQSEKPDTTGS